MSNPVAPIGPSIALEVYATWGAIALLAVAILTAVVFVTRRARRRTKLATPPSEFR